MTDQGERFFQNLVRMERFQDRLRRSRETKQLIYQRIDSIDLVADQIRKCVAKIGILITLGQQLGEGFQGDERVLDFVRHSGRERSQASESIAATNLQFESLDGGDVG